MFEANGILVYDKDTAIDMFKSLGMNNFDIEEVSTMLNEEELEEAEYQRDIAKEECEAMEACLEDIQSVLNEVLNIVEETLKMERISKPRERFEAIQKLIEYKL